MNLRLRTRLALTVGAAIVITFALLGYLITFERNTRMRSVVKQIALKVLQMRADDLSAHLQRTQEACRRLAAQAQRSDQRLEPPGSTHPLTLDASAAGMRYADTLGGWISWTSPAQDRLHVCETPPMEQVPWTTNGRGPRDPQPAWLAPHIDEKASGTPVITCVTPVIKNGRVTAFVGIDDNAATLLPSMRSLIRLGVSEVALIDKDGTCLIIPTEAAGRARVTHNIDDVGREHHDIISAETPIEGTPFKVRAWASIASLESDEHSFLLQQTAIGAIAVAILLALTLIITRTLTQPLASLERAADRVRRGQFNARVTVQESRGELTELGEAFNTLMTELDTRYQALRVGAVERERAEREITLASEAQSSMLPRLDMVPPGIEASAQSISARQVGGDLYDLFALPGNRVAFALGDTCGKGMGAALLMVQTVTALRSIAQLYERPSQCIAHLNHLATAMAYSVPLTTLFYGIVHLDDGRLVYCNAGHPAPIIDGEIVRTPAQPSLGAVDDALYRDDEISLRPGSTVVLVSDGITEAPGQESRFVGLDGVLREVRDAGAGISARDLVERLLALSQTGDADFEEDDATVAVVRYRGPSTVLRVAPRVDAVEPVLARIDGCDLPPADRLRLRLAVEELLVNVIEHGRSATSIEVTVVNRFDGVGVRLEDNGIRFDPTRQVKAAAVNPRAGDEALETPIGGKGLTLARHSVDDLCYVRWQGLNRLDVFKSRSAGDS